MFVFGLIAAVPAAAHSLCGTISTSGGGQHYTGAVTLTCDTLATDTGGGAIIFDSTVDGAFNLTVNTSGPTTFSGPVGSTTALTSLFTSGTGSTLLGANVTTSSTLEFTGTVTLGADVTLSSANGSGSTGVFFNSTLDGGHALTISPTLAVTVFAGNVGSTTPLTSLSVGAGGYTEVDSNVTTIGAQTYGNAVTLIYGSSPRTLTGSAIDFVSTLDGGEALTVNSPGLTTFGGAVGGTASLASLTKTTGTLAILSNDQILVSGNASIGGTLSVNFVAAPTIGQSFTVLNAGSLTSTFSSITTSGLSANEQAVVTYPGNNSVVLTIAGIPTITSISPTSGPAAGGTTVTITGTSFTGATAVQFGATTAASFTVNSDTSITATAPAGAGVVDITATTTVGGTSATSPADQFTYIAPPTPTITGLSPTSGPVAGRTSVTITGTNFTGATALNFGLTAATGVTVVSTTLITATAPAGTGVVDITVTTTSGGTSATSPADQFTYIATPTITALSPTNGPAAGGTTVAITGTNFTGATAVTFGATSATGVTVVSATAITATAPAGTGTVDVRVMTPGGGTSSTSAADQFTYIAAPTVTGLSPTVGPLAGGTSVTITGTNFTGAMAVHFGVTTATGVTVVSATSITATAPAGSGTIDVTVTTPGGTSATSTADQYTYGGTPAVSSLSPTGGPLAGGTSVAITGTNLTGATAVMFGATAATSYTVNSATSITATAPAGAKGVVDVTVTTIGGTSATSAADQFTYQGTPTLTVSATPNPSVIDTAVTLTATVSGDPPTGQIFFCDGATTTNATCTGGTLLACSPVTLTATTATSSTATCTQSFTALGKHSISAFYSGDGNFIATATTDVVIEAVGPVPVPAPLLERWALLLFGGLIGLITLVRVRRA